jgi:hypothetical protein
MNFTMQKTLGVLVQSSAFTTQFLVVTSIIQHDGMKRSQENNWVHHTANKLLQVETILVFTINNITMPTQ